MTKVLKVTKDYDMKSKLQNFGHNSILFRQKNNTVYILYKYLTYLILIEQLDCIQKCCLSSLIYIIYILQLAHPEIQSRPSELTLPII